MGLKINGTIQPVRTALRHTFDPNRGDTIVQEFASAGDNLGGLASVLRLFRIQFDHLASPRVSKIVATATGAQAGLPDNRVDTWQLLANEDHRSVKEHPYFLLMEYDYQAANPGQSAIGQVVSDLDAWNRGEDIDTTFYTDWPAAAQLLQLLLRGATHYAIGQYCLRHTTNVSNVYDGNIADFGVECVYTTSQLISEIADIFSWAFPCPGRLIYKISNIPAPDPVDGYLWGWRKLPSTETSAADCRVDISTEYQLGQWSTVLYAPA